MSLSIVKVVLEGESSWIEEEREAAGSNDAENGKCQKMTVMTVMMIIYYILSDNRWRFNFSFHVDDDFENITEKMRENIYYISIIQSEM